MKGQKEGIKTQHFDYPIFPTYKTSVHTTSNLIAGPNYQTH